MVGIRISQAWMALCVTDVYMTSRGFDVNAAVVAGALLVTVGYSLLGRGVCVPVLGRVSDALLKRGISRTALVIESLVMAAVSFQVLSMGVTAVWFLCLIAVLLGAAVNSFTLVIADASETYGSEKTGSVFSFMNMVGQLIGATSLAASGYIGLALSAGERNSLDEYRPWSRHR